MRRLTASACAVAALALFVPASAVAGTLTLHPAGFGPHSYSAWKAQQGEPDSKGNDNQSLYFQKMVPTATVAAGDAVVKGVEGIPVNELSGLAWDHREDGHCGAGAPRWNLVTDTGGTQMTTFLGCNASQHQEGAAASGHGWCRDTQMIPSFPPGTTIVSLSIHFDEGNDEMNPPPVGCNQEQMNGGFVYLDNIEVDTTDQAVGSKCWTSANDNSNQSSGPCPDPPSGNNAPAVPSLSAPSGVPASSDPSLAGALNLAAPGVPVSAWTLYPTVSR